MESILFALNLIAVAILCYFASKQDDKEKAKSSEKDQNNA